MKRRAGENRRVMGERGKEGGVRAGREQRGEALEKRNTWKDSGRRDERRDEDENMKGSVWRGKKKRGKESGGK